jgi:hypothetical protein
VALVVTGLQEQQMADLVVLAQFPVALEIFLLLMVDLVAVKALGAALLAVFIGLVVLVEHLLIHSH